MLVKMPDRDLEAPPLGERVCRGVGHALFPVAGLYGVFIEFPRSIMMAAEPLQLLVWAAFMLCGAVAAVSAVRGRHLYEYAALPFMIGGSSIYVVAMANIVVTGTNLGSGLALVMVAALTCHLITRWVSINRLLRNPWKLLTEKWGRKSRTLLVRSPRPPDRSEGSDE